MPEDWNSDALGDVATWLGQANTRQFLVMDRDSVVHDESWGDPASSIDIASAQKSVISVVVAVLVARGILDLDAPMSRWLGRGWTTATSDQEERILLRHGLTMTTGLFEDFGFEAEAGTAWYYNNNAYHQIRKVIERATSHTTQEVCAETLFAPLGMRDSRWVPRPAMKDPTGWVIEGLHTTAHDLARLGRAVLGGGRLGDVDLGCDPEYLAASMRASQDLNPSYGLLWWLPSAETGIVPGRRPGQEIEPRKPFGGIVLDGPIAPDAPVGTIAAMGAGDQRLILIPDREIVVVRLGGPIGAMEAAAGGFDREFWPRFQSALPDPRA